MKPISLALRNISTTNLNSMNHGHLIKDYLKVFKSERTCEEVP